MRTPSRHGCGGVAAAACLALATATLPASATDVADAPRADAPTAGTSTRVSVATGGAQASSDSFSPAISSFGRYVVFDSAASDLVRGDTNTATDVFVRDRQAQRTRRVSVATDGAQGDGASFDAAIAPHGRFVAFSSDATTLVPGDTNLERDVFVRDRRRQTTSRVSVATGGGQGNGSSQRPAISRAGRYVAFYSLASDLVPGDTNGAQDVFVRDRRSQTTVRVSVSTGGDQGDGDSSFPAISPDGRYVTYHSSASDLVPGDTNGAVDVFVRDLQERTTTRASVATGGGQGNGDSAAATISADGRYVAFQSFASHLVPGDTNDAFDVFVRDLQRQTTRRVSVATGGGQAKGGSLVPAISANGRHVTFSSSAFNLVPDDANDFRDVFVRDLRAHTTNRVSVSTDGGDADADAGRVPAISARGRYVAFDASASNLVPADTNSDSDVFVRDTRP